LERVWLALCDPAEVTAWDASVIAAIDAPPDYPQPGQHVRWRCRSGLWRILHDRPQEVIPHHRLRSLLEIGLTHMDETYRLSWTDSGCRLDLDVDVQSRLPVLGGLIEQLTTGVDTRRAFEVSLAGLKRHCESSR
jgi:hypothetical protein